MCPESISLVVHPPDPIFSSEPQSGLDALQHCLTISLSSADSFRASCVEVASHTPRHMIARSLGDVPRSRGCSSVRVEPTDGTRPQWTHSPCSALAGACGSEYIPGIRNQGRTERHVRDPGTTFPVGQHRFLCSSRSNGALALFLIETIVGGSMVNGIPRRPNHNFAWATSSQVPRCHPCTSPAGL